MTRLLLIGLVVAGCSGSPADESAHQNQSPTTPPPSAVVEDCTNGCDTPITLNTQGDVSYLTAADTALKFDLSDNLCARLTTPEDSKSELHIEDNGYTLSRCQVFDNKNIFGNHMVVVADPPGVPSWVRAEVGKAEYPGFCTLSCSEVTP